jgi:hypothetical protein
VHGATKLDGKKMEVIKQKKIAKKLVAKSTKLIDLLDYNNRNILTMN